MNQELRSRSCRLFQSVILVQDPFYIIIDLMYLFPMLYEFKELYTNTCNAFSLHSCWNLISSNRDTYTQFDLILNKFLQFLEKIGILNIFHFINIINGIKTMICSSFPLHISQKYGSLKHYFSSCFHLKVKLW